MRRISVGRQPIKVRKLREIVNLRSKICLFASGPFVAEEVGKDAGEREILF